MSPGDFENMFIKAGGSKRKEGFRVEEATGESQRDRGPWTHVQEVSPR